MSEPPEFWMRMGRQMMQFSWSTVHPAAVKMHPVLKLRRLNCIQVRIQVQYILHCFHFTTNGSLIASQSSQQNLYLSFSSSYAKYTWVSLQFNASPARTVTFPRNFHFKVCCVNDDEVFYLDRIEFNFLICSSSYLVYTISNDSLELWSPLNWGKITHKVT